MTLEMPSLQTILFTKCKEGVLYILLTKRIRPQFKSFKAMRWRYTLGGKGPTRFSFENLKAMLKVQAPSLMREAGASWVVALLAMLKAREAEARSVSFWGQGSLPTSSKEASPSVMPPTPSAMPTRHQDEWV